MPARLAIRAIVNTDNPGNLLHSQKGDIVAVGPANWDFGAAVILPNWITITVSNIRLKELQTYRKVWRRKAAISVISHNAVQDTYRLRLSGNQTAASGVGGFTRAEAEAFLDKWDAIYVSHNAGGVTFDLRIRDAGFSQGFWGRNVSNVSFAEIDYTKQTGKHICTADYSATPIDSNTVAHLAQARSVDILDNTGGVLTYEIDRSDIRTELLHDIDEATEYLIGKAQFAITEAAVDTVVAAGGTGTYTKAQLQSVLVDRVNG